MPNQYSKVPVADRFWSCVERAGAGCWTWRGARTQDGYGQFWIRGRNHRAHRVAYALTLGPIPAGLQVLHRCDNRLCCNPAHFFLGTNADNMADKVAKGRNVVLQGEAVAASKLTPDTVRAIRARFAAGGISKKALARQFGISDMTAARIIDRRAWKHVD